MSDLSEFKIRSVLKLLNISVEDLADAFGVSRQTAYRYIKAYDEDGPQAVDRDIAASFRFLAHSTEKDASDHLRYIKDYMIRSKVPRVSCSGSRLGRPEKPMADKLETKSRNIYRMLSDLSFEQSVSVIKSMIISMYSDLTEKYFGKYLEEQKHADIDFLSKLYEDNIKIFFFYNILNRLIDIPPYDACGFPESRAIKGYIESSLNHFSFDPEHLKERDPDFDESEILSTLGLQSLDFTRQWFVAMYFSKIGFHEPRPFCMLPEAYAAKDIEDARRIAAYVDERDNFDSGADYICILGPFLELPIAMDAKAFVWTDWDNRFNIAASESEMFEWIEGLKTNDYLEYNGLVDVSYRLSANSFDIKADKDAYMTWYVLDEVREEEEKLMNTYVKRDD